MSYSKEAIKKAISEKMVSFLGKQVSEEFTLKIIADELGITVPTIYNYFYNKEDVVESGYCTVLKEIENCLDSKFPKSISHDVQIKVCLMKIADYFLDKDIPAAWLVNDPPSTRCTFEPMRAKLSKMFALYLKVKEEEALHATYRHLSLLQGEIAYSRQMGKRLSDDAVEKIFEILK